MHLALNGCGYQTKRAAQMWGARELQLSAHIDIALSSEVYCRESEARLYRPPGINGRLVLVKLSSLSKTRTISRRSNLDGGVRNQPVIFIAPEDSRGASSSYLLCMLC